MSNVAYLLSEGYTCDRSGPLWRSFTDFHEKNPWVYLRLVKHINDIRKAGFSKYSTRTLIAVLRFEWDLKTTHQEVQVDGERRSVKLNDHHTAYYARMAIEEYPNLWNFFELRYAEGDPVGDSPVELEPEPDPEPIWDGIQRALF